jgi:hypothetical protein
MRKKSIHKNKKNRKKTYHKKTIHKNKTYHKKKNRKNKSRQRNIQRGGMEFTDQNVVEQLLKELEENEEQLRLAAEFGQTLLEKTEELHEEKETLEREAEEAKYRARELQGFLDRLSEENAERDATLEAERAEVERKEAAIEEKLRAMSGMGEKMEAAKAQADAEVAEAKAQADARVKLLEGKVATIEKKEGETALLVEEERAQRLEAQKAKKSAEELLVRAKSRFEGELHRALAEAATVKEMADNLEAANEKISTQMKKDSKSNGLKQNELRRENKILSNEIKRLAIEGEKTREEIKELATT